MKSIVEDFEAINKRMEAKKSPAKCWYCAGKGLVPDMSDPLKSNFCHLCSGSGMAAEDQMKPQGSNIRSIPVELAQAKVENWGKSDMIVIEVLGTAERFGIQKGGLFRIDQFIEWLKEASGRS